MNEQSVATCDSHDSVRQIEQMALRRLNGRVHGLKIMARGDGLVLQGHARTYYAKQLAQHTVMELSTLLIQSNEIVVP